VIREPIADEWEVHRSMVNGAFLIKQPTGYQSWVDHLKLNVAVPFKIANAGSWMLDAKLQQQILSN